jgi:hypothetical protein
MIHLKGVIPDHKELLEQLDREYPAESGEKGGDNGLIWRFYDDELEHSNIFKKNPTMHALMSWIRKSFESLGVRLELWTMLINKYTAGTKCKQHDDGLYRNNAVIILSLGESVDFQFVNYGGYRSATNGGVGDDVPFLYDETIRLDGGDLLMFGYDKDSKYDHVIHDISGDRYSIVFFVRPTRFEDVDALLRREDITIPPFKDGEHLVELETLIPPFAAITQSNFHWTQGYLFIDGECNR